MLEIAVSACNATNSLMASFIPDFKVVLAFLALSLFIFKRKEEDIRALRSSQYFQAAIHVFH